MEGLSHVHVTTKERDKAAAWLAAHTGLRVSKPTPRSENVLDGRLNLLQVQSSAPLAMEPDGSAWIASVGIAVSNLSAALASWAADGGAIVSQRSQCGVVEVATATDPWGVLFELIQSGSPGLSHVNVVAHEPDELLGWYAAHLGGVRRDGRGGTAAHRRPGGGAQQPQRPRAWRAQRCARRRAQRCAHRRRRRRRRRRRQRRPSPFYQLRRRAPLLQAIAHPQRLNYS